MDKVIRENGRATSVYHSSSEAHIEKFTPDHLPPTVATFSAFGFFFVVHNFLYQLP
jgi:hypothetical protein